MAARPEGFFIGDFYILRSKYSTQLIPRVHVSYVSATYSSTPLLLILGVLAIVLGLVMLANAQFQGDLQAPGLLATLGVILIVAFFSSRKIGVVVASSGGKLFVESRGKDRDALLKRIHDDLISQGDTATDIESARRFTATR